MDRNRLYRMIPKVDSLLETDRISVLIRTCGLRSVMEAVREETEALRVMIRELPDEPDSRAKAEEAVRALPGRIEDNLARLFTPGMRRVINGTGTILHTNLGRAPLGRKHAEAVSHLIAGYSNLDYDLESGKRSDRTVHYEDLLCRITGAEAALAVNNNAAAVLLVLHTLARGGEVIISRGELVEIGGKFRMPDVIRESGAVLREVGTTNKTRVSDYEKAITEDTRAIMKVNTSNYQIIGFTESVPAENLREIAPSGKILLIEDLGSGVLVNLERYGLAHELTVQEAVRSGADVVCFSGDKLLGGPQAGIIVGRKQYIEEMKRNQLIRALRVDKFTAAALELVLTEYLNEEAAMENIPVLRMIRESRDEVFKRAKALAKRLGSCDLKAEITVEETTSCVGGGALPAASIESMAVVIRPADMSAGTLERKLRNLPVPVIARSAEDAVRLDVRTIDPEDFPDLVTMLEEVLG